MSAGITDICHYAQLYIFTSLYFVLPASIVRVFHLSSFNYFSILKIEPRAHTLASAVSQLSFFSFYIFYIRSFKTITYRVMDFILSSHIFTLYLERGLHLRISFRMPLNSCSRAIQSFKLLIVLTRTPRLRSAPPDPALNFIFVAIIPMIKNILVVL